MIFNLGSINVDHVYDVQHFAEPGETLTSKQYTCFAGGKGLNQSIAAARAGAQVAHIGRCASDAQFCVNLMRDAGVQVSLVDQLAPVSGHAIIMVDASGENQIVLHPGANRQITRGHIEQALSLAEPGDLLVIQNETNGVIEAAKIARQAGAKIAYSAAPFDAQHVRSLLPLVDLIAVNQAEAASVVAALHLDVEEWGVQALITMGAQGAKFYDGQQWHHQPAIQTQVIDTTGAGDTFAGYFLAHLEHGAAAALEIAAKAAAIQVSRKGTAIAIPELSELA